MKKKITILSLFIVISIALCFIVNYTFATSDTMSINTSSTSVESGKTYTVTVNYSGSTTLGSIDFDMQFKNATCTLNSQNSNGSCKGTESDYNCSFYSTAGFASGTEFLNLSCVNNGTNATFSVSKSTIFAYDITGLTEVNVSGTSKTITAYTTTTTTTKETTTTTKETTTKSNTTTTKQTTQSTTEHPIKYETTKASETTTTTTTEITTVEPTTEETTTTSIKIIQEDLKLSELKIVGYNIDFKQNQTSYTIDIAKDVTEIYVLATTVKENSKVENTGIINIEGLDEVKVKVISEEGNELEYIIKLNREQVVDMSEIYLIIIFTLLLSIILVVIINIINTIKKNKKEEIKDSNEIIETLDNSNDIINLDDIKENNNTNIINNAEVQMNTNVNNIENNNVENTNNINEVNTNNI